MSKHRRVVIEGDPEATHLWVEEWGEDVVLGVHKPAQPGRHAEQWVDVSLVTTNAMRLEECLHAVRNKI